MRLFCVLISVILKFSLLNTPATTGSRIGFKSYQDEKEQTLVNRWTLNWHGECRRLGWTMWGVPWLIAHVLKAAEVSRGEKGQVYLSGLGEEYSVRLALKPWLREITWLTLNHTLYLLKTVMKTPSPDVTTNHNPEVSLLLLREIQNWLRFSMLKRNIVAKSLRVVKSSCY